MSLRHINIPSVPWAHPPRCPKYDLATRLQTKLQESLLSWKAAGDKSAPPPAPALITFTPAPTFTLGRRQDWPSQEQRKEMHKRLNVQTYRQTARATYSFIKPAIVRTPRGGLTTYHGPGQVLFWPVIDMRSPLHKHFTVREYVSLLEQTTIEAMRKAYDVEGFTDCDNPGVWAKRSRIVMGPEGEDMVLEDEPKKLASLGVHLRRHVTGLGIAVNFRMDLSDNHRDNPWVRIDPCGFDGSKVETIDRLARSRIPLEDAVETFIPTWAAEFARRLGVANAENPAAGPLIEADNWTKWIMDLDLLDTADHGYEIARKRKH
ncbi:hypothetical protein F4805DRAFT_18255 [Annulohypoxylon moriforme]|nr:hypothetical protein F4805DRAFT_18255 [Annulohypoxylon moriforme]